MPGCVIFRLRPSTLPKMNPIIRYFSAEKAWCSVGAAIAVLSAGVALWFFLKGRNAFQTGLAWPFLILGILFFIICLSVALRSDADATRVTTMVNGDLTTLKGVELPRMTAVMRN